MHPYVMRNWWKERPAHPDLGRTVREARKAQGMTLDELAAAAGICRRYVAYLQVGARCPSAVVAGRLEAVLGVEIPMPPVSLADLTVSSRRRILRSYQAQEDRIRASGLQLDRAR